MLFKRFLIRSSGRPPVRWSGTNYAILKEGIMGNFHVKLYERSMCIKGLKWPPLEQITEICFSQISLDSFIKKMAEM